MLAPVTVFLDSLTRDLIDREFGPVDADTRDAAAAWVRERFAGAGDVTAPGLRVTGRLVAAAILVIERRPYAALPAERRAAVLGRLLTTRMPLAAEYVRAIRSLAVAYVYEDRFSQAC